MCSVKISPSLLSADHNDIASEIIKAEHFGAEYIHIDVMDGKFVPNTSFGVDYVKEFSKVGSIIKDVHIMIENPLKFAEEYLKAGSEILTFHYEACKENEIGEIISLIHSYGAKAGISIKPKTDPSILLPYLEDVDLVLIMSVEPGFGGQSFINSAIDKISYLAELKQEKHYNYLIEVDGGINKDTAKLCKDAGVEILVAGSYLYGHDNFQERMESLR